MIGGFGALLVLAYFPILKNLVAQWSADEDMGHGFFVPVVAGYIAWKLRPRLAAARIRTNYLGLVLLVWGAIQVTLGVVGVELFLQRTAFIFSLVGLVVFLAGIEATAILSFPLVLLVFMVPIPTIVLTQITFPLQLLASRLGEFLLLLCGIPVLREGNVLELASQKLSVVEACSGIRSLLSLSFLALVYAYFFDNRAWMRVFLLLATAPIAISANAARIFLTGLLTEYDAKLAQGFLHGAQGWVLFMVALGLLILTHRLTCRILRVSRARQ